DVLTLCGDVLTLCGDVPTHCGEIILIQKAFPKISGICHRKCSPLQKRRAAVSFPGTEIILKKGTPCEK
ncbi:MAG: hypothetical protein KGZ58_01670, partial [Ignavibacteriales bacterium]|nr:hypothetical protein [Ignavibacteriales bacterium]